MTTQFNNADGSRSFFVGMLNGTLDFPYLYFHMLSLLQEPAIKILLVQYSLLHNHHRLVRGANDVVSSVIDLPLAHVHR